MTDYLAIIFIGGGSCFGRSPDKEKAIATALRHLKDWDVYFKVDDIDVTVNVLDVTGFDEWSWDTLGFSARAEGGEWERVERPIERIAHHTPAKKTRRKKT